MITLVPAATPVTRPVLLTVATPVEEETQGFDEAAVADPVNCLVDPAQTLKVPLIVGKGLMLIVAVVLIFTEQLGVPDV